VQNEHFRDSKLWEHLHIFAFLEKEKSLFASILGYLTQYKFHNPRVQYKEESKIMANIEKTKETYYSI
jgi:hypothetical protein